MCHKNCILMWRANTGCPKWCHPEFRCFENCLTTSLALSTCSSKLNLFQRKTYNRNETVHDVSNACWLSPVNLKMYSKAYLKRQVFFKHLPRWIKRFRFFIAVAALSHLSSFYKIILSFFPEEYNLNLLLYLNISQQTMRYSYIM